MFHKILFLLIPIIINILLLPDFALNFDKIDQSSIYENNDFLKFLFNFSSFSSNITKDLPTESPTLIAELNIITPETNLPILSPRTLTNRSVAESITNKKILKQKEKNVANVIESKNFTQNLTNILVDRSNNNAIIYILDFELTVNEFINFEPKSGLVELDAKLIYKWWDKVNKQEIITNEESLQSTSSNQIKKFSQLIESKEFYPSISFKDKDVEFKIKNQIHTIDNVQIIVEQKEETQESLLANFERLNSNKKQAFFSALISNNSTDDIFSSPEAKNFTTKKKIKRQYSCLEQNVTIKFKCKQSNDLNYMDSSNHLDTTRFPFDFHLCELDFDLIPTLLTSKRSILPKETDPFEPVYLFSLKDITNKKTKIELDTFFYEYNLYNKLVQTSSNYSWISKEWFLKKLEIFYKNSTSPYLISNIFESETNDKLDRVLLTRKDLMDFKEAKIKNIINDNLHFTFKTSKNRNNLKRSIDNGNKSKYDEMYENINTTAQKLSSNAKPNPASITVRFSIFRKREPQVYIFVLPLALFTLITFIIFFMPTTNSSEKTLIAFLNFACLLAYNIYIFKLVIYTYEFFQLPLMLQYSNCLMIIQLGVLAYTCLVKSVYNYGFLTLNKTYPYSTEDAYKEFLLMNSNHSKIQNDEIQVYNLITDKIKHDESEPVIYHGCEKGESNQECLVGAENNQNIDKCLILSRSSESVKLNMPIIKLNESDAEAMNAITTIVNDENNYISYNQVESVIGNISQQKCACNIDESDADCCNNSRDHMMHNIINGCVNSGSGTIVNSAPNISKIVSVANDLVLAGAVDAQKNSSSSIESEKNEFLISSNKAFNSNWIFGRCCGSSTPDIGKISPSPLCEHVRPIDIKRGRDKRRNDNKKSFYRVSTATTHQLMPEYDYTSHLTRLKEPVLINVHKTNDTLRSNLKENNINLNNLNQESKNLSIKVKQNQMFNFFDALSKENTNTNMNNTLIKNMRQNFFNEMIGNASYEITKLNMNMNRMIKLEEILVKERILRDEWRRKARLCDGICCLLVFFLLAICSLFIFIILPSVKTASLMD